MLMQKIEEYYKGHNLNCAETILYAANDEYNLGLDKNAFKMAAGFGAGMYTGTVCGALSGGIMAISRLFVDDKAHTSPNLKALVEEFLSRYSNKMGDINCSYLREKHHNKEVRCLNVIKEAGIILDEMVKREMGSTQTNK